MIECAIDFQVAKAPGEVFAYVDDMSKTPLWNERCVEVRQTSPGPRQVGSKLLYKYREPGRQRQMDGEVTAYEKDRRIAMKYSDKLMDVAIEFAFDAAENGTRVHHRIEIHPKSLLTKLMTPIIRSATRKQTDGSTRKIKELLERPA